MYEKKPDHHHNYNKDIYVIRNVPSIEDLQRKIDIQLEKIKITSSKQLRKKMIRNLIKKNHPDKHAGHKNYDTIFQYLQQQLVNIKK
jgi:DnaJ-domain-containing protein 1